MTLKEVAEKAIYMELGTERKFTLNKKPTMVERKELSITFAKVMGKSFSVYQTGKTLLIQCYQPLEEG